MTAKRFLSRAVLVVILLPSPCLCQERSGIPDEETPVPHIEYLGQPPPGLTPEVFAPGVVSRDSIGYWEHSFPAFSPDGREVYWSVYSHGFEDQALYFSRRDGDRWSSPKGAPFSGGYRDGGPAFSPDGKRLFFSSTRPKRGGDAPINIWFVERTKGGWGEPQKLGLPINTDRGEANPSFAGDGTLYFSSTRDGGRGRSDIWRSKWVDGKYAEPENLGGSINTEDADYAPCIAPDESFLVFSRHEQSQWGQGVDLHVSFRRPDGAWTQAENMGKAVPLFRNAKFPGLSPDGRYLFFVGYEGGHPDVYWVDVRVLDRFDPFRDRTGRETGLSPAPSRADDGG